jgi:hypothetical protein
MAYTIKTKKGKAKIRLVMHEFKAGKLHSGSGGMVTNPRQAVAIAISEGRKHGG